MKTKIYLFVLLSFLSFNSKSTHIMGTDMYCTQISANQFVVTARVFRFCLSPTLAINIAGFRVYERNTNVLKQTLTLSKDTVYSYAGIASSSLSFCFDIGVYSDTITLANNTNGYYVTSNICCRTSSIYNTASSSGNLWTCDIPNPAIIGRNSNPVFTGNPASIGLCVGRNVNLDFSCTDPDGDSLIYSLVQPFSSGNSKPYTLAPYNASYSLTTILGPGSACTINSSTGIVTARSQQIGVYVIAVTCEEYRNGVKIGEVNRDVVIPSINCSFLTVKEKDLSSQIKIYPNPSNGIFKMEKPETLENVTVKVYDIFGKIVLSQEMNNDIEKIDLSSVSKGIYTVKLITENTQIIKRIIKN